MGPARGRQRADAREVLSAPSPARAPAAPGPSFVAATLLLDIPRRCEESSTCRIDRGERCEDIAQSRLQLAREVPPDTVGPGASAPSGVEAQDTREDVAGAQEGRQHD